MEDDNMNLKSKKGYSLIEIAVGILILTVFLICSSALFNGAYNTYRMIQQRNIATNLAVKTMEDLLQTDSNILTGFYVEEYDADGKYYLEVNDEFLSYVKNYMPYAYKNVYAEMNNISSSDVGTLSDEQIRECIFYDSEYIINEYIGKEVSSYSEELLENGGYCLFDTGYNSEWGNLALIYPGTFSEEELNTYLGETTAVRTSVLRLRENEGTVYGNNVLKLKVEVFYTNKINLSNLTEADVKTITLETIKIAK